MPSLVLCSRRTPFSGDELRSISVFACLFRLLQLALGLALIAYTTIQKNHFSGFDDLLLQCKEDGDFSAFASNGVPILYAQGATSICLSVFGIGAAIPTFIISAKGTPTNSEPRKALLAICYFNISTMNVFRTLGFILSIFSTFILSAYCQCIEGELTVAPTKEQLREACPRGSEWIGAMIALNVTHAIDVIVAVTESIYFFCPRTSCCPEILPSETWWKACFTCCIGCTSSLTCCVFGGAEALRGDFGDLAVVMSNYTANNHLIDVTLSDILAGLIMVVRCQREQLLEARERVHQSFYSNGEEEAPELKAASQQRRFSDSNTNERDGDETKPRPTLKRMTSTPEYSFREIGGLDPTDNELILKREVLSPDNHQEKFFMAEAARFMPMAHATYTWLMFLMEYRLFGFLKLGYLILRRCACFCPSPRDKVSNDFPWEAHMIALEQLSGLDAEDIVFASFKQSIAAVPYMIALDHEWKSVVIAIRGTLTMESILADIAIRPAELTTVGEKCGFDGNGRYCHRGMLKTCQWIYDDIMKRGKLKEVMEGEYKNYRLRVVGHSLGAGCAAMLSLMLRPSHPRLRCLAFSPPGCVFSDNLADECSSWTTSYVLDADIVPRLAIGPFEDLRDSVLKMICRIKVPKHKVFDLSRTGTKGREELTEENESVLYDDDEVPDSEFKRQVDRFLEFQAELKQKTGSESYIELYPPGKIIQIFLALHQKNSFFKLTSLPGMRDPNRKRRKAEKNYIARWIHREDLQHVIVSSHLLGDHEPTNVKHQIQKVAETKFNLASPLYKVFDERSEA